MTWEEEQRNKLRELLLGYFGTDKTMVYHNLENAMIRFIDQERKEAVREVFVKFIENEVNKWNGKRMKNIVRESTKNDINKFLKKLNIKEI